MTSPAIPVSSSAVPSEVLVTPGNVAGQGVGIPEALADYLDRCRTRRVKPNTYFQTMLRSVDFIVALDFRGGQYLSDGGTECVAACVPSLPHLRLLSVAENGVTNTGLLALCDAIDKQRALQVLDLHGNSRITRVGGQRLLNTVGRAQSISCCNLHGTRMGDYFETRVQRHCAAHYYACTEHERSQVDAMVVSLSCSTAGVGGGGERRLESFALRLKSSASVASPTQLFKNTHYDEAVDVVHGDGDTDLDSDDCVDAEELDALRPLAPSALETVLHAGTPDFVDVTTSGPYAITRHGRRRTVYNIATPAGRRFVVSPDGRGTPFPEAAEFAEIIASYRPREIELEYKFMFPGKIDYVPVVHAPDPMLSPPLPQPMAFRRRPEEGGQRARTVAGTAMSSMYWSFFDSVSSANTASSTDAAAAARTTTGSHGASTGSAEQHPQSAAAATTDDGDTAAVASKSPEELAAEKERIFLLERASDSVCGNTSLLSYRSVSGQSKAVVPERRPLSDLVSDPAWVPSQPTRGRQVDHYNASHRLKYNTVSGERFQVTGVFQREYVLQRVLRHNKATERLTAGALNTRGTILATSSYDMTCKLWSTETGERLHVLQGHEGHISECGFNRTACDKVVTASYDKTVRVWSVEDGSLLHTLRGHELEVVALSVSKDGRWIASGGMDDLSIVWDLEKGTEVCTLAGHTGEVVTLAFSPDGERVVSGGMDEAVRIWDVSDGTCSSTLVGHTMEIGHVSFNCFGNMVLSGSLDCTCRLWDTATGACKVLRGHSREIVDCCFSPTGWQCASVSDDQTVRIWDVLTGGCITMITGHTNGVCHVAFNNAGTELLTGSMDMTARLWNVETGDCLQVLRGHRGVVLVSYSGDCERIMTISKDNSCRVWKREPEANSLLHFAALAICQHPTVYQDAVEKGVPDHLQTVLRRMHHRLFLTERDAVVTPLPAMETPISVDEDGLVHSPTPGPAGAMSASLHLPTSPSAPPGGGPGHAA